MNYTLNGETVRVEETHPIIKMGNYLFKLDGDKAMFCDMHVYTICKEAFTLSYGPDYKEYKGYMDVPMRFVEWSKLPPEKIENEERFSLNGDIYEVKNADRSWPLPELFYNGELVGEIDTETDMEGEMERKIKWK